MSSLPEDIITIILLALPVKSIARFKCVCKQWLQLFENHGFINMHLNHAIQNNRHIALLQPFYASAWYHRVGFDAASTPSVSLCATEFKFPWKTAERDVFKFIGSCNGLLCYKSTYEAYLWNPSTGEFKEICRPISREYSDGAYAYGFGYDKKVDDYKLILFHSLPTSTDSKVQVYTLGSNSWKETGDIPYDMHHVEAPMRLLKGAIHWVWKEVIVSFDIAEEQTKEIQIPSCILGERHTAISNVDLGVLGENLCLSLEAFPDKFDLWVMKDYGVVDSWIKLFSIPKENPSWCSLRPLQSFDTNSDTLVCKLTTVEWHPSRADLYEVVLGARKYPLHKRARTV